MLKSCRDGACPHPCNKKYVGADHHPPVTKMGGLILSKFLVRKMKKRHIALIALFLVIGVFIYFNADLFFSQPPIPRKNPRSINVQVGFKEGQPIHEWKIEDRVKVQSIMKMLREGIELHGHQHDPFAGLDLFYPDDKVTKVFLYSGHLENTFEFLYKRKTYVVDGDTFFEVMYNAGIDIKKISQGDHHDHRSKLNDIH